MEAPVISVGILTQKALSFAFYPEYVQTGDGQFLKGEQRALLVDGKIVFNGRLYKELYFEPTSPDASFELKGVTIGVDFHWQRQEDQRFKGALKLLATPDGIVAINQIDLEEYLTSVISSEMSANASKELLKAHAVISRSWLLAQIEKKLQLGQSSEQHVSSTHQDEESLIRWYDREDHTLFDVCADDHCQRYQGISRASNPTVVEAINETRGEILTYNDKICDARFSKCCGGVTETFENCWEPVHHDYLIALRDDERHDFPDLTNEENARAWITTSPTAFCHTNDQKILSQVLNNYDLETADFYRWEIFYSRKELSELIARKTGIDFGEIIDLIPVERGTSGRLIRLRIVGTKRSMIIGKELEIRRALSESHLYSSAFIVEKEGDPKAPSRFILKGAGWGHGVGLCQIGAAVMGAKGYDYQAILTHYFPNAVIERRY